MACPELKHKHSIALELLFREERFGDCTLVTTQYCPKEVHVDLARLLTEHSGIWFKPTPQNSRRPIYVLDLEGNQVIVKQKVRHHSPETPRVARYTCSLIHELRTLEKTRAIVENNAGSLPQSLKIGDKIIPIQFEVQKPYGYIIDHSTVQRYGLFEYFSGTSLRNEVTEGGHWNDLSQDLRYRVGAIHAYLNAVAKILVENGLEPWDIGAHQIVYRFTVDGVLEFMLLDTEEFRPLYTNSAVSWPESFSTIGLPPVLLLLSMLDDNRD